LVFLVGIVVIVFVVASGRSQPGTVLVLDLDAALAERATADVQELWTGAPLDLLGLRRALHKAAKDPDVSGLLLRLSKPPLQAGMAEEVWRQLRAFREHEKFVVAHVDSPNLLGYFLATAADEILLDSSGGVDAVGIHLQAFFLKDALADFGLQADFLRVGAYKGAFEQLTRATPTPEFDLAMDAIAGSLFESLLGLIAEARGVEPAEVEAALGRCPVLADEALEAKLVDAVVHGDELSARIDQRVPAGAHYVCLRQYLSQSGAGRRGGSSIAVVHVSGMMVEGPSGRSPLSGTVAGAETVVKALRDASEDSDVVGILLRIDSTGGAVTAAEKMWRAASIAAQHKPVFASFGNAAASGGYYVASAADRVFAQATTLTGSIGIFGGKIVIGGLLDRFHVGHKTYSRGENARIFDSTRPFTAAERLSLQQILEESYRKFVSRVAKGRAKGFEAIDAVAQGRVWTGQAAIGAGLVDVVGGFDDALEALVEASKVSGEVTLKLFPERKGVLDLVVEREKPPQVRALPLGVAPYSGSSPEAHRSAYELYAWLRRTRLFDDMARLTMLPFALEVR